jgi:hypothetical protein
MRRVLLSFAVLTLAPALLCSLIAAAFFMAPIALVGIPFMVPAMFPGASNEEPQAVDRPAPRLVPAHASH